MDITTLSETELKALAYDAFVNIQNNQNNLNLINQEFARRKQASEQAAPVVQFPEVEKPKRKAKEQVHAAVAQVS